MSESMSLAVVALEGDAERGGSFVARVESSRWNGWARCWFAAGEVDRMRERSASGFFALESGAPALVWSASGVLLEASESEGPVEWLTVPTLEVDGVTLYGVGDGWVWLEVPALLEPCALCAWSDLHGMHYCESEYGSECGHDCEGPTCFYAPSDALERRDAATSAGGAL